MEIGNYRDELVKLKNEVVAYNYNSNSHDGKLLVSNLDYWIRNLEYEIVLYPLEVDSNIARPVNFSKLDIDGAFQPFTDEDYSALLDELILRAIKYIGHTAKAVKEINWKEVDEILL